MKTTITITNKGQTTLPAAMRHKMGLDRKGGILQVRFDERAGEIIIAKPVSVDELSTRLSRYIKSGTKPVLDVDEYYQTHRKASIGE